MKILLVNDDGIKAEGLKAIAKELSLKHEVFIVAPMTEQSGMSQALTMGVPLRVETVDMKMENVTAYAVEGTPADCTKLALEFLLKEKPDLIISGINNVSKRKTFINEISFIDKYIKELEPVVYDSRIIKMVIGYFNDMDKVIKEALDCVRKELVK